MTGKGRSMKYKHHKDSQSPSHSRSDYLHCAEIRAWTHLEQISGHIKVYYARFS